MVEYNIEALFLDVDSTLLTSGFTVSNINIRSIMRLRKTGVKIILASGRPLAALAKFVKMLSLESYVLILNGGCVVDLLNNDIIFLSEMSQEYIPTVASVAKEYGVSPCIYTPESWYVENVDDNVMLEIRRSESDREYCPLIKFQGQSSKFS